MTPGIPSNSAIVDERLAREDVVRLGLWLFLATVTMLFAAFVSAYIVRRSGSDWTRSALPAVLWLNTAVLAASSVAIETAVRAGRGSNWRGANRTWTAAALLGATFLGGQIFAWRQLLAAGVVVSTTPRAAFFYMLTGAHALHVVAALSLLAWTSVAGWRRLARIDPGRWRMLTDTCRTFWHFLSVVWLALFVLMANF